MNYEVTFRDREEGDLAPIEVRGVDDAHQATQLARHRVGLDDSKWQLWTVRPIEARS